MAAGRRGCSPPKLIPARHHAKIASCRHHQHRAGGERAKARSHSRIRTTICGAPSPPVRGAGRDAVRPARRPDARNDRSGRGIAAYGRRCSGSASTKCRPTMICGCKRWSRQTAVRLRPERQPPPPTAMNSQAPVLTPPPRQRNGGAADTATDTRPRWPGQPARGRCRYLAERLAAATIRLCLRPIARRQLCRGRTRARATSSSAIPTTAYRATRNIGSAKPITCGAISRPRPPPSPRDISAIRKGRRPPTIC